MIDKNYPLHAGDALLVVDLQNDFCPSGALAVHEGDQVVPEINRWIQAAFQRGVPVFASRDWHPENHISFKARGGPWPPHCIQGTHGAEFHPDLRLPRTAVIINKATRPDKDSYSAFGDNDLAHRLRMSNVQRLWICGLALDYCVRETAADARRLGHDVHVIASATRAVNVHPDDGKRTLKELQDMGVVIENERDFRAA